MPPATACFRNRAINPSEMEEGEANRATNGKTTRIETALEKTAETTSSGGSAAAGVITGFLSGWSEGKNEVAPLELIPLLQHRVEEDGRNEEKNKQDGNHHHAAMEGCNLMVFDVVMLGKAAGTAGVGAMYQTPSYNQEENNPGQ